MRVVSTRVLLVASSLLSAAATNSTSGTCAGWNGSCPIGTQKRGHSHHCGCAQANSSCCTEMMCCLPALYTRHGNYTCTGMNLEITGHTVPKFNGVYGIRSDTWATNFNESKALVIELAAGGNTTALCSAHNCSCSAFGIPRTWSPWGIDCGCSCSFGKCLRVFRSLLLHMCSRQA